MNFDLDDTGITLPEPKRFIRSSENEELQVLAAVMSYWRNTCQCGAVHDNGAQYLMYRFRRGTNGRPFLQTGKASLMRLWPGIPREVIYRNRRVECCSACYHPTVEPSIQQGW